MNINNEIIVNSPHKDFESIKKIDDSGIEYWTARELLNILGYKEWRNFEETIYKAKQACLNSKQYTYDHFVEVNKMVRIGSGSVREIKDYNLDRYACYLIAQNGDSGKKEIAFAQTYFAIQTRNQEIQQNLSDDEKRIRARDEVKKKNKELFSIARIAGVSNFGKFNDVGYKGLYSMSLKEIEDKKKVCQTIKEIGGEMPENLKSERHIKKIRKSPQKMLK